FFLRYGVEREASAAHFRWRLLPETSGAAPFDPRAPAGPRFRASLERGRIGMARRAAGAGTDFSVDWTGHGFVVVGDGRGNRQGHPASAQAPGAAPAALGDRLPRAG